MIALRCGGHAAHPEVPGFGLFLKDMDFEGRIDERAMEGSGRPTFTADIAEAKRFADMREMHAFYCRQPKIRPYRDDGHPNRPMTGYHWQIVEVPE